MLELHAIPGAPLEVNCYLVADRAAGEAVLVDAPLQVAEAMTRQAEAWGVRVTALLCTHGHWDHTMGLPELLAAFPAPVAVHAGDADLLEHPTFAPFSFPFTLTPVTPDRLLNEGDTVPVGDHTLTVLSTPGHTPGSVCFYDETDGVCITGDTLFAGTCGRTDFPGGDPEAMVHSLLRLRTLPPATRIYPGHGPATTIEKERWLARVEEMDLG
jgi:glyoxylase-like metal-dependent hydrolase (beta-lactamase superfamily II)